MAELQQVQQLPAPFIEAAGKDYLGMLTGAIGGAKGIDLKFLRTLSFFSEFTHKFPGF